MGRMRPPAFVGRVAELGRLEDVFARACAGSPSMLLIGGDAGVGKSRLVEEFAARTREHEALVLIGSCSGPSAGGLACGPVTEALQGLGEQIGIGRLRDLAGDRKEELGRLCTDLRPAEHRLDRSPHAQLEASSQQQLWHALLCLLEQLSAGTPVVLTLEDLHWSDAPTRDLLVYLAHNLRETRVLALGTFRTGDAAPDEAWQPVLAHLIRQDLVERIDLEPFGRERLSHVGQAPTGRTAVAADDIDQPRTVPRPAHPKSSAGAWIREGTSWALTFAGRTVRIPDARGLADLAVLLSHPGRKVAATDLMSVTADSSDLGPVIDSQAPRAYEQRTSDLPEALDETQPPGNLARTELPRPDFDQFIDHFAAGMALARRERRTWSSVERARSAVTHRIREVIGKITHLHPALGRHLEHTVHTGRWCVYVPGKDRVTWTVELNRRSRTDTTGH